MASASASRASGSTGRIRTAATTVYAENQSLIAEIRKAMSMMKELVVDLERDNQPQMVKELENAVLELLGAHQDCTHFSSAIHSVGDKYQPGEELTNFKKLFEDEAAKNKANSDSVIESHPIMRQFREAIWNVHHAGEPMPGEEQDDIVITSTQGSLLNITPIGQYMHEMFWGRSFPSSEKLGRRYLRPTWRIGSFNSILPYSRLRSTLHQHLCLSPSPPPPLQIINNEISPCPNPPFPETA